MYIIPSALNNLIKLLTSLPGKSNWKNLRELDLGKSFLQALYKIVLE